MTVGQTLSLKDFDTANFCQATGVMLHAGESYRIVIRQKDDWYDGKVPVKPGNSALDRASQFQKAMFYIALPLRRALFEHWFTITLRYGAVGGEKSFYYVDPNDPIIQFPVKPTRHGELFVFVNDAVLGIPGLYGYFYRNNRGTAAIELTRLK